MKIFMYSDVHISKTSSIMPNNSDNKYTYRQNMIIETGKYLNNGKLLHHRYIHTVYYPLYHNKINLKQNVFDFEHNKSL